MARRVSFDRKQPEKPKQRHLYASDVTEPQPLVPEKQSPTNLVEMISSGMSKANIGRGAPPPATPQPQEPTDFLGGITGALKSISEIIQSPGAQRVAAQLTGDPYEKIGRLQRAESIEKRQTEERLREQEREFEQEQLQRAQQIKAEEAELGREFQREQMEREFELRGEEAKTKRKPLKFEFNEKIGIWNPYEGTVLMPIGELGVPTVDTEKQFDQEMKLRNSFQKITKDFRAIRDSWGRVVASAKDPSAAGDLALIFNFMKILDPGSTVREGEFATAQNSGSVPNRIWAYYNKILAGERLAGGEGGQRQDFVDRAKKLYQERLNQYEKTENQFTSLAKSYNLDPKRVVLEFRREDEDEELDYDPTTGEFK